MGIKTGYAPGTFCWADVRSIDQDGTKAFYSELFGWTAVDQPIGDGIYYSTMLKDGHSVAAISPMSPEMCALKVPQHWGSYISVADADAATQKARELGATILAEPFHVFTAGRMAVIKDPSGAIVSLWQPIDHMGAELAGDTGSRCWTELLTNDTAAACAFYRALFGWTIATDMPGPETYTVFQKGDHLVGGMMPIPCEGGEIPPHWAVYFAVSNADETIAKTQELGGQVWFGPMDVAEIGRIATLSDPQGGAFSILQPATQTCSP